MRPHEGSGEGTGAPATEIVKQYSSCQGFTPLDPVGHLFRQFEYWDAAYSKVYRGLSSGPVWPESDGLAGLLARLERISATPPAKGPERDNTAQETSAG